MNHSKPVLKALAAILAAVVVCLAAILNFERLVEPEGEPSDLPFLELNQTDITLNTTRIGSDDPVQTAVAISNIIYPVTEEENSPGAVVLVNRERLAEVMAAANRAQHFPINAPLLYAEQNSLPDLTRQELLRLKPEGVPMDGNTQVYLIGTLGPEVRQEVEALGYRTRTITAPDPIELVVALDDWSSTQHGDHPNEVGIANLDHLEPAVPVAFWNAHMGQGFAYVTDDGIPEPTRQMLARRANGPYLYLFGDESVISREVAAELAAYGQVTRILGSTPTETSTFFAGFKDQGGDWGAWFWESARDFGWGLSEAGHNLTFINLDGPAGWQNGLAATTLSHMGKHAPVIILEGGQVTDSVANYMKILKPYPTAPRQQLLNHGWIIGGEETIPWETQVELDRMLEAYAPALEADQAAYEIGNLEAIHP